MHEVMNIAWTKFAGGIVFGIRTEIDIAEIRWRG